MVGGVAYVIAVDRRGRGHPGSLMRRRVGAFVGAFMVVALALESPLDAASHHNVAWHMIQHLLLTVVAPPLFVLARPIETFVWLLPPHARRRAMTLWARFVAAIGRHWSAWVTVAAATSMTTIWAWHVPALYDLATDHVVVHDIEHLSMAWTGFVFWWLVLGARRAWRYGEAVLVVFVTSLGSIGVGAMLLLAPQPLYELSRRSATGLREQQVAGAVMWGVGGAVTLGVAISLFTRWLRWHEARSPAR